MYTWLREGGSAELLAEALKQIYDASYQSDPFRAKAAADLLCVLAELVDHAGVRGLAAWVSGLTALDSGQLSRAVELLSEAEEHFAEAGLRAKAASVQVGRLIALAMQGRLDEAIEVGRAALISAQAGGDLATVAKIAQNLGNVEFIRHRYLDAEEHYRLAKTYIEQVGDLRQLAQIENCLATTLTSQHRFAEAEALYADALRHAQRTHSEMTLAEIECNLGCLALYQGQFAQALDYLERSRRRYMQLDMPHELAIAEQELADAYLELNLAHEAADIYARVASIFAELSMPVEEARACAYHARAAILLGRMQQAHELLKRARALYETLQMPVGVAITLLTEAQLHIWGDDLETADALLRQVEPVFAEARAEGWRLVTGWLRGLIARRQNRLAEARWILTATQKDAEQNLALQTVQRCLTELGLAALAEKNVAQAENYFRRAIELIESMRAPLPAEEFRMGFLGDKLTPYVEMVRLCLVDGSPERLKEALTYIERSRAQALLDLLHSAPSMFTPRDAFEAELMAQIEQLRRELNWFYTQINRPDDAHHERGLTLELLNREARHREVSIQALLRQLHQRNVRPVDSSFSFDLAALRKELGEETALVEYFAIDDELVAFVVTDNELATIELEGGLGDVVDLLQKLRFQLGAIRGNGGPLRRHMPALVERTQRLLRQLYGLLLAPLTSLLGNRRLAIAPYQTLHYIPFHALHDGERYIVETREVVVAPSAALLHHCLKKSVRPPQRALLVGKPDEYAPRVADEVAALAPLFAHSTVLLDDQATWMQLQAQSPAADLLHIACHGRFRNDNPFFSALHLADGWVFVRDAYTLQLDCSLVTLSACETGLSALAPGDELVGLARGFLLAGAPSLLVSLWMVDDAATAELMAHFYQALLSGLRPAAALRQAQRALLARHPHPFFWAPFTLIGRW
ncbi:CHAT domain-containing protein [Caldilinea sp.]|uniref:CHAT domain-containing protein n=1 Tax=Caldilinea sp. TaxID=2293560 RepID=UPI00261AD713|nr:CHAT domain-containing protein [uncultured Caldilinea sp.]